MAAPKTGCRFSAVRPTTLSLFPPSCCACEHRLSTKLAFSGDRHALSQSSAEFNTCALGTGRDMCAGLC
ncbi:hypothetical protein E2C01_087968 [Portunus trituberculatus]|uniref:Uncharacterized protein n=1 Tax=Portunus trituberculatus TaxID=210409 RepID=A0A5B7JE43_PORTR|nr:hypothetical protein [Portunus trituberculatus]